MRLLRMLVCAVVIGAGCAAVSQQSNTDAVPPAKQESQKPPCEPPKAVFTPQPSPPASWEGKGPKSALTLLEVMVDKKGKVHDPLVIQSGGEDVDKEAIEAVRRWRFKPPRCGTDPIETKIQVSVTIRLQ